MDECAEIIMENMQSILMKVSYFILDQVYKHTWQLSVYCGISLLGK